MKYTKQQLLGAIFEWPSGKYVVVNYDEDEVQLMHRMSGEFFASYDLARLNNCIQHLIELPNKTLQYEIY